MSIVKKLIQGDGSCTYAHRGGQRYPQKQVAARLEPIGMVSGSAIGAVDTIRLCERLELALHIVYLGLHHLHLRMLMQIDG